MLVGKLTSLIFYIYISVTILERFLSLVETNRSRTADGIEERTKAVSVYLLYFPSNAAIHSNYFMKGRELDALDCLAFCFLFIIADLAHRRKLEGQICADTVHCHIAEACQWRQDQKNVRPACASFFLARWSGIISSHPQEADVRGEQASPGESGRCLAELTPQSHPFGPHLQTDSPGFGSAVTHRWTHQLASGAHNALTWVKQTATSSTTTTFLYTTLLRN